MSERLRKFQRMRAAADFSRPRTEGVRYDCGAFLVRFLRSRVAGEGEPLQRLAVIASKRIGKAHVRNRCKRQARELFRRHLSELPAAVDVLVIVRKDWPVWEFDALRDAYLKGASRAVRLWPAYLAADEKETTDDAS